MTKGKKKVWVLTYECNEYDQQGEYFAAVFENKPTIDQLIDATGNRDHCPDVGALLKFLLHVQNGGGRREVEHTWYNLSEVELG